MKTLVIIPARGGSKGLPKKNVKELHGKPLIHYSIETARSCFDDQDICVSTDDAEIVKIVERTGLQVPFLRPDFLATDQASTRDVVLHALSHYNNSGIAYDQVMLLQPTSPFRDKEHLKQMIQMKENDPKVDMVVSVKESKDNPYFNLFEEEGGHLHKSKQGDFLRRQDCPKVYAYNGSVYLFNRSSIEAKRFHEFENVVKFLMEDEMYNLDIDTPRDWRLAEYLLNQ